MIAVLLVLLLVAGAGAFNYWRNLGSEEAVPRPYRGYADAELDALIAAYRSEVDALDARYQQARDGRSVRQVSRGAHISDHVKGFEEAREAADRVRGRAADVAGQAAVLRDLEVEQATRASNRGFDVHWRRLTTL